MTESFKILGNSKVRYDWYQTEAQVIINVLQKNIDASQLKINCSSLSIKIELPGISDDLVLHLAHNIDTNRVISKVSPAKLEVRLYKVDALHWGKLEGEDIQEGKPIPKETSATENVKKPKNWDEVVKNEPVDEEDQLNELFKKIYSEGSDDVRRAMNKSFMESGGTVLSTNWKEVESEKVEIKPPEGMEWKKWD